MAGSAPAFRHHLLSSSLTSKNSNFLFNSNFHCSLRLTKPLLSLSSSSPSPSPSSGHSHITRVTTAPVEYTLPPPEFDFRREISRLEALRRRLSDSKCLKDKIKVIEGDQRVKSFFNSRRYGFSRVLASMNLSEYELFLLKCLVAAGQEHVLSLGCEFVDSEVESAGSSVKSALYALVEMIEKLDVSSGDEGLKKSIGLTLNEEDIGDLRKLLNNLGEVEQFYDCIGGIIG